MTHLILSPHPDDAAFSCGALIASLTRVGSPVLIYTLNAGDPPPGLRLTPLIEELHVRWNLGDAPAARRRDEDRTAAALLDAMIEFSPYPDAIYRTDPDDGSPLYPGEGNIFGDVHFHDPATAEMQAQALFAHLADRLNDTPLVAIYAPLGVGHHVDHQIARDVGLLLAGRWPSSAVCFYEEYPYARQGRGAVLKALRGFSPAEKLLRLRRVPDEAALRVKIAASGAHRSQRSTFWADDSAMDADLRDYNALAGGESFWRLCR